MNSTALAIVTTTLIALAAAWAALPQPSDAYRYKTQASDGWIRVTLLDAPDPPIQPPVSNRTTCTTPTLPCTTPTTYDVGQTVYIPCPADRITVGTNTTKAPCPSSSSS